MNNVKIRDFLKELRITIGHREKIITKLNSIAYSARPYSQTSTSLHACMSTTEMVAKDLAGLKIKNSENTEELNKHIDNNYSAKRGNTKSIDQAAIMQN